MNGEAEDCRIPIKAIEEHFRQTWRPSECEADAYAVDGGREPVQLGPFSAIEVQRRLSRFENTAPGNDGLTYRHWKDIDPEAELSCLVLNICLKCRRIPAEWKEPITILIPKKGDLSCVFNWWPIAMCWTVYKLYISCVADRLMKWIVENSDLAVARRFLCRRMVRSSMFTLSID